MTFGLLCLFGMLVGWLALVVLFSIKIWTSNVRFLAVYPRIMLWIGGATFFCTFFVLLAVLG